MVALHTARICEFFVKCLCSGLWSGSFSVFFSVVWSSSPTASLKFIRLLPVVFSSQQRAFSWILFFQFFKVCVSSCSFRTQTTNNSLSTMSSPVFSASLSSRSGSTPAPPVNTPASPPSKPVSLPDNNSLVQAI